MSSAINSANPAVTSAASQAVTPNGNDKVTATATSTAPPIASSPSAVSTTVSVTTTAPRKTSPATAVPQPQQQTAAVNGSSAKPAKPRPLKLPNQAGVPLLAGGHHGGSGLLGHHPNVVYASFGNPQSASVHFGSGSSPAHHHVTETLSTDELLDLMEHINKAVKASQFSPTLAGQIFKLYNQLKTCGEALEQSNRAELNRVFVSLRQACCRDSGQLGTPCRLKMMELVELRAMGWRPNLAHSQYYMTRSVTGANVTNGGGMTSPDFHHGDSMTGGELEQLGAAPVSAPPFGAVPINPFAFNIPAPMPSAADLVSANQALGQPSYYLIPAAHMNHPPTGITFVGPPSTAAMMPPPPPQPMTHHPLTATYSTPAVLTSMAALQNASPPINFPRQAATAKPSTKFSRPTKVPGKNQFRDEVVIRNADSGKIMGVKGRRVALIEEISKTVISFQKVPQGAKERTLTVTGPSEESIIQAKILIEDTIRRNVSPVRADGQSGELLSHADAISEGDSDEIYENGAADNSSSTNHETDSAVAELESILKQNCADPEVLKAAGAALKLYLQRHEHQRHEPLRRSATDAYVKHKDKERRKSMPLPLLTNVPEAVESENVNPNIKTAEDVENEQPVATNAHVKLKLSARSTPNLAAGERRNVLKPMASLRVAGEETKLDADDDNRPVCRIVYTRDFLLQCAASCGSKSAPPSLPTISEQLTDIVPSGREPFDPSIYKQKVVEFKQTRV